MLAESHNFPISNYKSFIKRQKKQKAKTKAKTMRTFLLSLITLAFARNEASASNNLRGHQRQWNQRELQEGVRMFARYSGQRGHRLAKKCARKIIQDNDDDDILIFEGDGLCMEQLLGDVDIIEADFDNEVYVLGSGGANTKDPIRTLEEIIPWGLEMIQADQLDAGDNEIVVCIVDSGIALEHPDFVSDMITGNDTVKFYGPRWDWKTDKRGHGTHVAGIIAAMADNGVGVKGAGSFRLHITRALGDDGRGYESDIRFAVQQCVDAGAHIINLSLGGPYMSYRSNLYYTQVVEEFGIMMVAAAGNDGTTDKVYPASHPSVISVGAVYEWGTRCHYSNMGDQLEFAAPGHNIMSTTVSASSVHTNDFAYHAVHINGALDGSATSELVYCDVDDSKCKNAKKGGICLMTKDGTSIQDMLESCQQGGGTGAVIFHANSDSDITNWSVAQGTITIPAVAVKRSIGSQLMLETIGDTVTIGDADNDEIEYTYTEYTGTSMASPHVAAAAALLWSHFGECTNHQIRYALAMTAHNPEGGCDESYGYGVVKAEDAYEWLSENDCITWDVPQVSQGGCTTL
jgi:serine protease